MELLLTLLIYPLLKKVGEPWLDRIAASFDRILVELLRNVVHSKPGAEVALSDYLSTNPKAAAVLEEEALKSLTTDDIATSLRATMVPNVDALLLHFKAVIDFVVDLARRLRRPVVVKGFFNVPQCVTIFEMTDYSQPSPTIITDLQCVEWNRELTISVLPTLDDIVKTERFNALNGIARDGSFALIRKATADGYVVDGVYRTWVRYEKLHGADYALFPVPEFHRRLQASSSKPRAYRPPILPRDISEYPEELQKRLRIASYDAVGEMVRSVAEIAAQERQDLDDIRAQLKPV